MRNFKRTLALVLAVIMVVGTFATVSAASIAWTQAAVDYIEDIGVAVIGNDADQPITRNDFVLWVAKIESHQPEDNAWNVSIDSVDFTDVTDEHHKAAIAYAYKAHYVEGNGDGTFAPDRVLTLAEACAVIVRLLRYESKVVGLPGEWDTNYMSVAVQYCRALDSTFLTKTGTFDPNYQLNKGEAAYLLATIMNGINKDVDNLITTADGIDIGAYWEGNKGTGVKQSTFYVTNLGRVSQGLTQYSPYINGTPVERYTNAFDGTVDVTLKSADGKNTLVIPGEEFAKLVRVSLGLAPSRDYMNEEAEINIFETVRVGTMVDVVVDAQILAKGSIKSYKEVSKFAVNTNSVVVDTVLQMTSGNEAFVGYGVAAKGSADYRPTLPTSYDATMATSWTNVKKDTTGKVTGATLNFKGVAYEYGSDIVAYDANWNELAVDVAVNTLLNAAQGECYAVFNDVDGDGDYDNVYIKESYAFAYTKTPNVASKDTTVYEYVTSISNGAVVGTATAKGNAIGTVIWNKAVGYSNNTYGNHSTDPYTLTDSATGKLQLVLCAANAHPTYDAALYNGYGSQLCYYTVVDLAAFYTGIIEEVDAYSVEGYYTAKVKTLDNAIVTVYIPLEAVASVEIPVTIGGATADYTFDCSAWGTFMTDTKAAALEAGIAMPENVVNGDTTEYLNFTAAWMAGKFVEFATNDENVVICINGTEKTTGTTGFVTNVAKTETGDNTYNVTIATSGNYTTSETVYFTLTNMPTDANLLKSSFNEAEFGKHIYWHAASVFTQAQDANGENYYFIADANGKPYATEDGILCDKSGRLLIDNIYNTTNVRVSGLTTKEVRAAASGMFDWANYNVYNQLFNGVLLDPNTAQNAEVDAGKDLIYVTLMKDAGTLGYVLYNGYSNAVETTTWARSSSYHPLNGQYGNNKWYWGTFTTTTPAEKAWVDVEGEYIIDLKEIAGTRKVKLDQNGKECGYTALYDATVGFEPHYDRTWNATTKSYVYTLGFRTVKVMTNILGDTDAVLDTVKTYMIPLYEGEQNVKSNQVVCKTEEDKKLFTLENGFYVDKDNLVFILVAATITYKTDKDGKLLYEATEYDWASATLLTEYTDVAFTNTTVLGKAVNAYATMTITEKPSTAEGWFPGSYYINIDGTSYNVTVASKVVLVTPSSNGFVTTVKTVDELVKTKTTAFFATEWSAVIGNGNTIDTIAVLGTDNLTVPTPEAPVTPVDKNTVVYLDGTAKAVVKHNEHANTWMVISDKSAYALPTGEEVGAIYRSYPTYAEALNASIEIDLSVEGGKWYVVNENNEIVGSYGLVNADGTLNTLTGTITEVKADGTTIATMNGKANVDITKTATEYFYFDAEGKVLYIAGDNTNVSIIAKAGFDSLFTTQVKAVENAQTAYDNAKAKYDAGNLSAERLAYYAENLAAAEKALVDAKASSLDKYFNGQFWGFANSPLYKYNVMSQGTFQQGKPTLTFNYVMVGDTLCVFSDSFVLG